MKLDAYRDCKKIMKEFIKKEYWTKFSSADIFYILEGRNKSLFTFVEQFFNESFGIQLFFNDNGFNYVHDILTINSENVISLVDCDSLCAVFISKEDLKPEEISFLKKNKIRIMENNNFLVYRFEPGYNHRLANNKEYSLLLKHLEFISSIIENEHQELIEAFNEGHAAVSVMDMQEMQYSIVYRPLPYLEAIPKKLKANIAFAEEFKAATYLDDECYCFSAYTPIVIKETGVRPLIMYFYYPKLKKHYFKYIIDSPKEYKNCIFGILYDVFHEIGKPIKMLINNRNIHALMTKTLDYMDIENCFLREEAKVDDNVNDLVARLYNQNMSDIVDSEDVVSKLLDGISQTLNVIPEYDDDDNESLSYNFVS